MEERAEDVLKLKRTRTNKEREAEHSREKG